MVTVSDKILHTSLRASAAGATQLELAEAMDNDDSPKAAIIALILAKEAQLQGMKLGALRWFHPSSSFTISA